MLIKLADKCNMMCRHCMDDAQEVGHIMTLDTFKNAVNFGLFIGSSFYVLSGGEPTENEHIEEMCEWLKHVGCSFSIVSNGMWLKDESKRQRIERICTMYNYVGMQVYTNKQWYKEYDYVVNHKNEYSKYNNVIVDNESPIFMQDLGRARTDIEAQKEVEKNPHFMSCLNTTLASVQTKKPQDLGVQLMLNRMFCKPSVDSHGNVHMSESRLCPSVGNVCTDNYEDIWKRMKEFRPCGQCKGYKKFIESKRMDIMSARMVLGL